MRLLDALLALPLIFGISMAAQRADGLLRYNSSDPEVERRWYSIPVDEKAGPDERRPWPLCGNGKRVISYCFGDDRAYRDIGDLFLKGIAKWAHVMHISSVVFAPDTACLGPQWRGRCLCSTPGVKEDSLHIILSDNQASSTVGYLPPSAPNPNPSLPRNNIIWPKHIGFSKAFAPVVMAHEIGHTLGLNHEHQRPDRASYLKVDCTVINGYEEAKAKVKGLKPGDEQAFTAKMSLDQKMDLVCKDKGLAIKYFNYFAWNYFPVARKTATQWHSEPFDYNSIMIYSSVTDVRDELGPGHYSISTLKGDYIYTGGNPDPELAGPSPLDILRVAQLYSFREFNDGPPRGPPPGKRSDDANALPSKLPTLEFVVSGQLTTTIAPTPTDFPKSMNDSKAIDLMKKFAALCNGGCHGDSVAQ